MRRSRRDRAGWQALCSGARTGDFELEDDINIYPGSSKENYRADQIGSGKIIRPAALAAAGQGMIASVLVQEGERVMRGQPLFMLDSAGQALRVRRRGKAGSAL